MATFRYLARDQTGSSCSGQMTAGSTAEAAKLLRSEGKFVVRLQELAQAPTAQQIAERTGSKRVKRAEVIFLLAQLSLMVDAGVPIADALDGILKQTRPGAMRRVLSSILKTVESGAPLSEALAAHPKAFGSFVVNLVRAAEMSGRLGETLHRISLYLAAQREIVTTVRRAMMYPLFLACMGVSVVIFLMTYLLPKFTVIYSGREALLPLPTRMVISVSSWMIAYWPYWSGSLVLIVGGLILYLRSPAGRRVGHWLLLNLPITGKMVHKATITRSLHTLGTLIDSGVSVLDGVAITKRISGNLYFERLWDRVGKDLQRGLQLSEPLYASAIFPRPLTQMIEAGEKSGQLGPVMKRISSWLEKDLKESIDGATKLLEPLMILIVGSFVGTIAIAMLLPIFTLAKNLSR